jgi:hypothetical protein
MAHEMETGWAISTNRLAVYSFSLYRGQEMAAAGKEQYGHS